MTSLESADDKHLAQRLLCCQMVKKMENFEFFVEGHFWDPADILAVRVAVGCLLEHSH